MPHIQPSHPLDPVRLQPPIYMRDGPMQVMRYPCPCGHELCLQPVLVNNHHYQAIVRAQERRFHNELYGNNEEAPENVPNVNGNHLAPENYDHQEPPRREYPTDPEVELRERRRNAINRSSSIRADVGEIDR